VTLFLRPHCEQEQSGDDERQPLGNAPTFDYLINVTTGGSHTTACPNFEVEDPQTLRTDRLDAGETLDLDIVVRNDAKYEMQQVRAWLSYDPSVLHGVRITVSDAFPHVTPGEADFDAENGFAMINASAEEGGEPQSEEIVIARVIFTVEDTVVGGTPISFYDAQRDGHTMIIRKDAANPEGAYALEVDPGSLHVIFGRDDGQECIENYECLTGTCVDGTCKQTELLADGEDCLLDSQCEGDQCSNGICQTATTAPASALNEDTPECSTDAECTETDLCVAGTCEPVQATEDSCLIDSDCTEGGICVSGACEEQLLFPNGAPCMFDEDCESGLCLQATCQPPGSTATPPPQNTFSEQTAFSLLQVRNLRATTDESAVYLGWDSLQSSQLKAYNIYYGTTSGQYIQRKTVEGSMQSLVLRPLPNGTQYYFAIRAVNTADEESAFSQEIGVVVGNPSTSTAPLALGSSGLSQYEGNLFANRGSVPGETGVPTVLALFFLTSAIIGTIFAAKRQSRALIRQP